MADDAARLGRHGSRAARTAGADGGVLALVPVFGWAVGWSCEGALLLDPSMRRRELTFVALAPVWDNQTKPAVLTKLAMMGLTSSFLAACPTATGLSSVGLLCKASLVLTFFALTSEALTAPEACGELQVRDLFCLLRNFVLLCEERAAVVLRSPGRRLRQPLPGSQLHLCRLRGSWAAGRPSLSDRQPCLLLF